MWGKTKKKNIWKNYSTFPYILEYQLYIQTHTLSLKIMLAHTCRLKQVNLHSISNKLDYNIDTNMTCKQYYDR